MAKIKLNDNVQDIFIKMSDGNPGALFALSEIYKNGEEIDPQSFAKGFGPILNLDTLGIYGSDIYVLWNDQCDRDVRLMVMLLRANQLGFLSNDRLVAIFADQMRVDKLSSEELNDLDEQVCSRLPEFKKPNIESLKSA